VGDPEITEDQAGIEVELASGARLTRFVEKSLGNISRPLTNQQLEEKFRDQAVLAIRAGHVERAIELCWSIADLPDVNELIRSAVP
jgi:hypothetical protein